MTPLSLVGMSMSARKRAALRAWLTSPAVEFHPDFCERYPHIGPGRDGLAHEEYLRQRAAYRIGEHLRPCLTCDGGRWYVAPDVGCVDCGSAGVLPAKRSVKP